MTKILLSLFMVFGLTCCQGGPNSGDYDDDSDDDATTLNRSSKSYSKHDLLSQRIATIRNSRAPVRRR